jgi:hypothetical protein
MNLLFTPFVNEAVRVGRSALPDAPVQAENPPRRRLGLSRRRRSRAGLERGAACCPAPG